MLHWFMPRHTPAAPMTAPSLPAILGPETQASTIESATVDPKDSKDSKANKTNKHTKLSKPILDRSLAQAARKPAAKISRTKRLRSPLQIIPGVGPAAVEDFHRLGITEVAELKGRDPQALYDALTELDGQPHDRCVLYVFRAAVYFASTSRHDPEKLKWWNWKDAPPRKAR